MKGSSDAYRRDALRTANPRSALTSELLDLLETPGVRVDWVGPAGSSELLKLWTTRTSVARRAGLPTVRMEGLLSQLSSERRSLLILYVYGKTTHFAAFADSKSYEIVSLLRYSRDGMGEWTPTP